MGEAGLIVVYLASTHFTTSPPLSVTTLSIWRDANAHVTRFPHFHLDHPEHPLSAPHFPVISISLSPCLQSLPSLLQRTYLLLTLILTPSLCHSLPFLSPSLSTSSSFVPLFLSSCFGWTVSQVTQVITYVAPLVTLSCTKFIVTSWLRQSLLEWLKGCYYGDFKTLCVLCEGVYAQGHAATVHISRVHKNTFYILTVLLCIQSFAFNPVQCDGSLQSLLSLSLIITATVGMLDISAVHSCQMP